MNSSVDKSAEGDIVNGACVKEACVNQAPEGAIQKNRGGGGQKKKIYIFFVWEACECGCVPTALLPLFACISTCLSRSLCRP